MNEIHRAHHLGHLQHLAVITPPIRLRTNYIVLPLTASKASLAEISVRENGNNSVADVINTALSPINRRVIFMLQAFSETPFKNRPFLGGYDMNWTLPAWVAIYTTTPPIAVTFP
ncbi:hypothetical protein AVEN_256116-1 [Araneus ventricosus]|uniref:Uncharacterized protein n=1 Tax=Araneus ventricosus TaxID=182803 RepID=A0A4Y2D7V6_ARAVE|nr:hypothetical protein AVEN_256116-1 [Araneus ventricosus]